MPGMDPPARLPMQRTTFCYPPVIACFPRAILRKISDLLLMFFRCARPRARAAAQLARPELLRRRPCPRGGVAGHLGAEAGVGGGVEQLRDRRLVEMRGNAAVGGEQ